MRDMHTHKSDGCTLFPDSAAWGEEWTSCCYDHDFAYWKGGCKEERLIADKALRDCVTAKGHPYIAKLMYWAVRLFGGAFFPTTHRWGYGHCDITRGYAELTKAERAEVALLSADDKKVVYKAL